MVSGFGTISPYAVGVRRTTINWYSEAEHSTRKPAYFRNRFLLNYGFLSEISIHSSIPFRFSIYYTLVSR